MTHHVPESMWDLGIEGHAFYEKHDGKVAYGAQTSPFSPFLQKTDLRSGSEDQDKGFPVPPFPCSVTSGKSYQSLQDSVFSFIQLG